METSLEAIQTQVNKIKNNILVRVIENPSSFISPSAYDTAWLAMIGDPNENNEKPMFKSCLEWVLSNQRPEGFWGERDCHGNPTIDSLPATLACIIALKMWDYGHEHIEKGLAFVRGSLTEIKIEDINDDYPRWFAIVFPGMVELASRAGLRFMFPDDMKEIVAHSFSQHRKILQTEELVDRYHYPPLLSYLEVLPSSYQIEEATIAKYLSGDGSLYQSPAATAAAYIATKNPEMLSYLRNLVRNCSQGVPSMYPIDEGSIKLKMVNHLQKLGLSDHFNGEIKTISEEIYSHYNEQEAVQQDLIPANIFKSSLAFEVLRLQGYKVSPRKFCGFLNDEYALQHIKDNSEMFASILYNLYRITNLMFESEEELRELRSFSRSLLAECCLSSKPINDGIMMWPHLQEGIERELLVPWMARMEHLDHRKWIEVNEESLLWLGKASFYRISCLDNMDLLQLAKQNYEYRQMIYKKELVELIRWSKVWGLTDMGFAREKTTYCYFAIASSSDFHYDSDIRLVVAKSAVLITVFDDFFDMEGSLDDLQTLAEAVQRWDNKGLRSHSKILFHVLDNFVDEVAKKYHDQHKIDITDNLRKMWYEVIDSWLTEATWSKTGEIPSMASYLDTGMISIAAHVLVLQASCFTPSNSNPCHHGLNPSQYEAITKLLMTSCRLLNDIQSYEKEVKDGKINSVLLHLKENPKANIEDAVNYVENILEETKMKLLEHALMMDGIDDSFPRPCKMLHLSALKVFQMFFNSANHFDSKESLLNDINKAIFVPFEDHTSFNLPKPLTFPSRPKKMHSMVNSHYSINLKNFSKSTKLTMHQIPLSISLKSHQLIRMKNIPPSCSLRFAC